MTASLTVTPFAHKLTTNVQISRFSHAVYVQVYDSYVKFNPCYFSLVLLTVFKDIYALYVDASIFCKISLQPKHKMQEEKKSIVVKTTRLLCVPLLLHFAARPILLNQISPICQPEKINSTRITLRVHEFRPLVDICYWLSGYRCYSSFRTILRLCFSISLQSLA